MAQAVKHLPARLGDLGSIPGLGRSPGEGNGNPLRYSCLGNPMDRGPGAGYRPWGCKGSDATERLYFHFTLHQSKFSFMGIKTSKAVAKQW